MLYHAKHPLRVYVVVPDESDVANISRSLTQVLTKLNGIGRGAACSFEVLNGADYMDRIRSFPKNNSRRDLTSAAYLKFYIQKLIDEDAILYVDVDVVVLGDLGEVANKYLDSLEYIAAVGNSDTGQQHWRTLASIHDLNPVSYFNTGVMLMNLRELRESRADELLETVVKDHAELMIHKDQDAFNVIFNRKHWPLDQKYNVHDFSLGLNYSGVFERFILGGLNILSNGMLHEALKEQVGPDTVVCHYSAQPKPWEPNGYYCRAHSDIWFRYAKIVLDPAEYATFHSLRNIGSAFWFRAKQIGQLHIAAARRLIGGVIRRST